MQDGWLIESNLLRFCRNSHCPDLTVAASAAV
jgi:hypothetical protein